MNAGPGRPSGGGGKHRRRRGRRSSRRGGSGSGPAMGRDRQNHGGIYTAPMDHSYRANMQGGENGSRAGRSRPGFGGAYKPADPDPVPGARAEDSASHLALWMTCFLSEDSGDRSAR
jgi:hypothetical protein